MFGEAGKDGVQPNFRINGVEFRGADQRVHDGG